MYSPLEQFNLLALRVSLWGEYDWTFFQVILVLVFVWLFSRLQVRWIWESYRGFLLPTAWQSFGEEMFLLIQSILRQQAGPAAVVYLPLFSALFFFILLANLFSLLPFSVALTAQMLPILFLSLTLLSGLVVTGFARLGLKFLKLFIPESPLALMLLLIPIEIFSYGLRSVSLAIRLSANLMAGHTLVHIVSGFLLSLNTIFQSAFLLLLWAVLLLEVGVACLQAYVFVILLAIYLKDSLTLASH